jgi:hypothetical protein
MMDLYNKGEYANSDEVQASVTGLVTASGWDKHNNITQLKLFSTDEDEYIIENGISFICALKKFIQAKGLIKKDIYGGKSIIIKEFKVVEQGFGEGFPVEDF